MRLILILGSVVAAWVSQAWTWFDQPDDADRLALIERVTEFIQPDDELAYLPGWEQHWALHLGQRFPGHKQRLGALDMLRPFMRLWVLESHDAPTLTSLQTENIEVLKTIQHKGLSARLLQRQGRVQPMAWPSLEGCQLSARRQSCSAPSGRLQTTELGFDGRFAWGQKITVKSQSMKLALRSKPGSILIGGFGWTGHGLRHSKGEASVRLSGAQTLTRKLTGQAGLDGFELEADARGQIEIVITLNGWTGAELGLSSGWAQ